MKESDKTNEDLARPLAPRPQWWKLPFDPTTNFSLFGCIIGGFRCDYPRNRAEFTLPGPPPEEDE
jgi:hypothetical protein